jgi:hypothetical protein
MLKFLTRACLLAGLLALAPAFAQAKTWTIPDPNPVAVVTIPDDWDTTKLKWGVETVSEDEDIYLAIEVVDDSSIEKDIEHAIEWLASKKVKIDATSMKQGPFKLNGMDGVTIIWQAKDEDGPTEVMLMILQTSDKKGIMITAWGSEEAQKENKEDLDAILGSIRAVK